MLCVNRIGEFEKLTAQFGSTVMDYVDIDVTLETENIDSDISQIITSEQIEQEEEIDKEESNQEETRITSADAAMYIN